MMVTTDSSPPMEDSVSEGGGGVNSRHSPRRWSLPSPLASVVRGDSEENSSLTSFVAAAAPLVEHDITKIESSGLEWQPESSDINGDANADPPRRPAWSRLLNGVAEPASVMGGAASWPALSKSPQPPLRSLSNTSGPVADGSASSSQRPANTNANARGNSPGNNPMPARPRPRNRGGSGGGGGGGSSSGRGPPQNSFNQPSVPMPPPFPFEGPYRMIPPVLDNSIRSVRPIGAGGVGASQTHTGNDHSSQRNNSRRSSSYGVRPRGVGSYHNNPGGRREQDRRDVHPPPPYVPPPMGYMPPPLPPNAVTYMIPPHMRVFPEQMGFDMTSPFLYAPPMPPEHFRAMPMVPPPMVFPPTNENPLTSMIVKQIDFYFSDENLVKDSFLRSKMDDHGWVPISLIASFRRVQHLTKDIQVISESLRYSTVVEVEGDNVRKRNEWKKWLLSSGFVSSESGSHSLVQTAASLKKVSLDDSLKNASGNMNAKESLMEMDAGQLTDWSRLSNGDDVAEAHPIS